MSNYYLRGLLTNELVLEELMKMAQDMASARQEGGKSSLSLEEMAFYDALTSYVVGMVLSVVLLPDIRHPKISFYQQKLHGQGSGDYRDR